MRTTVKLSSIKIPKSYAATIPSEKKVRIKRKKYRKGSDLFPLGKQSEISTLCIKVTKYNPVLFSIVSPAFWDES